MIFRSLNLTLLLALPLQTSLAQTVPEPGTAPVQAAQSQPVAAGISTITVLGKLARQPKGTVIRRLDRNSAASCAYSSIGHADAILDNYLESFYGENYGEGTVARHPGLQSSAEQRERKAGLISESPIDDERTNDISFDENYPFGGDVTRSPEEDVPERNISTEYKTNLCGPGDRLAASGRHAIARKDKSYLQGMNAYEQKDYGAAMQAFLANWNKLGWSEAGLMVALMHMRGEGVPRDLKTAAVWLDKVALQRSNDYDHVDWDPRNPHQQTAQVEAAMRLANLYLAGEGVPRNSKRAFQLIERAADLNFVPARVTLARMLLTGAGGIKDPNAALKQYEEAAKAGYAPAQYGLAQLYVSGAAGQQAPTKAFGWFQQAAFNPHDASRKPWAEYQLARLHDEGRGTAADPKAAAVLYQRAAVRGHPEAQNALGTYFYTGQIVPKDVKTALRLFRASAEQGQPDAMFNVAAILFRGESGLKDIPQAYAWLRIADKSGHPQAGKLAEVLAKQLGPEERAKADALLAPITAMDTARPNG